MMEGFYLFLRNLESVSVTLVMFAFLNTMFLPRRDSRRISGLKILLCVLAIVYLNSFNKPTLNLCGCLLITVLAAAWVFQLSLWHSVLYISFFQSLMINVEMIAVFLYPVLGMDQENIDLSRIFFLAAEIIAKLLLVEVIRRQVKSFDIERDHSYMGFLSLFSAAVFVLLLSGIYPESGAYRSNVFMVFTAMFFILGGVAGFSLEEKMMETDRERRTNQLLAQKANLEQLHYKRMEELTREYGAYVHELENSLRTFRQLWESGSGGIREAQAQALEKQSRQFRRRLYLSDPIMNAILTEREKKCREQGIRFEVSLSPELCLDFIEDIDKISMFGNLLDNAVEAAVQTKNGFVSINLYMGNKALFVFRIENSLSAAPKEKNGRYLTTKQDKRSHGYGIKKVRELALKYNGILDLRQEEGVFTASLILSIVQKTEN